MSLTNETENLQLKYEKAAFILKTIAHPSRLAIINLLEKNPVMSVSEICSALDCEQSLVSHHLTNMKIKGLLKSEKNGVQVLYSLKEQKLLSILTCIEGCDCNM
jgi:DNA-binding transcriptional ArsR family regulator